MKKEKREKLKKQILEHKLNDNNPNELIHAKLDASLAKHNTVTAPINSALSAAGIALGIFALVSTWPIGILFAIPSFTFSVLCTSLVAKQIKLVKNYGEKYGLSFNETVKSLFDKEVFEIMAINNIDLKNKIKSNEPEEHYEPKQPIYSLTDEELLEKQTTEIEKQNESKQPIKSVKKEESQVEEEIEQEK